MIGRNLTANAKIGRSVDATVAGTTDINGATIDMEGFDAVTWIAAFGTLTATQVTKLKAQQGNASDLSDADDITGAVTAALGDSDGTKLLVLELIRPTKRYVRCVVDRGTANAVIDGVVHIQTHAAKVPVTNGSTVSATKTFVGV